MPAHAELLAAFDAALRGGALPPGVTARLPDEVPRRFAVYRNNVAAGLADALAARFPVVQRLLGDAYFRALARIYAEAHRPGSPVLAEWGVDFAEFLAGFAPLGAYPYLADVARIEYARGRAFHAADALPIDPSALVEADPETLRLGLHPSVLLLRLSFPAVSIWARNQPGAETAHPPAPMPQSAENALILRDAGFEVQLHAIGPGDAALVEAMLSGATLGRAAALARLDEPDHDPQLLLVLLMRAGAITDRKE